jgi:hypothetical protein
MKDYIEDRINSTMEALEKAIIICNNVDESSGDTEQSYPYASGYSQATMRSAIDDLESVVKMLKDL